MRPYLPYLAAFLGLLLPWTTSKAPATVALALSLEGLVKQASHIAVVHLDHLHSHRADALIVTEVFLTVEAQLKGQHLKNRTLQLRCLGGTHGGVAMQVAGEATFQPGQRWLVFARPDTQKHLRPLGMAQGVLPIRKQDGIDMVCPGGKGLHLTSRGAKGQLVTATAALSQCQPLASLKSQIQVLLSPPRQP